MSTQITTAFVEQYSSNVTMLSQQMGSKLRGAVDVETVRGKNAFFDQIGSTAAVARTTRHGATPQVDTPHSRRRVSLSDFEWADLIDDLDKVRMLIDPTSQYAKAAAAAMGRSMDDQIITALGGSADTGVAGGTAVALPAGQIVGATDQTDGLTIAKLLDTKLILDNADVDPSLRRYIVCGPQQIQDLLNTTEVKNSDFNTVKALAQGSINSFMGFDFIMSTRLVKDATHTTDEKSMRSQKMLSNLQSVLTKARIDERNDKSYATQVITLWRLVLLEWKKKK